MHSSPPACLVQVASVVVYMVCGLFSSSFITNFVVVTILLMLDFWTVRLPTPHNLLCLHCQTSKANLFQLLQVLSAVTAEVTGPPEHLRRAELCLGVTLAACADRRRTWRAACWWACATGMRSLMRAATGALRLWRPYAPPPHHTDYHFLTYKGTVGLLTATVCLRSFTTMGNGAEADALPHTHRASEP